MSVGFFKAVPDEELNDSPERLLLSLPRAWATGVILFSNAMCAVFDQAPAMEYEPEFVDVNEPVFSRAVESAFENPDALTFRWALFAATLYENLHGQAYNWEWPTEHYPVRWSGIANDYVLLQPLEKPGAHSFRVACVRLGTRVFTFRPWI